MPKQVVPPKVECNICKHKVFTWNMKMHKDNHILRAKVKCDICYRYIICDNMHVHYKRVHDMTYIPKSVLKEELISDDYDQDKDVESEQVVKAKPLIISSSASVVGTNLFSITNSHLHTNGLIHCNVQHVLNKDDDKMLSTKDNDVDIIDCSYNGDEVETTIVSKLEKNVVFRECVNIDYYGCVNTDKLFVVDKNKSISAKKCGHNVLCY